MVISPARIVENEARDASKSGPSPEGRANSRRNSLKHGLSGAGVVVPEGDREKIDRQIADLTADLKPASTAGVFLIAQMATLAVRANRAAEQESAAVAYNVRHATDAFDEERIEAAEALFKALDQDPRNNLRKLKKSPEGVDRLVDAWNDLRNDLTIDPEPLWSPQHLEQAARMTGLKPQHARGSRFGALSRGFWGDFAALKDHEAEGLDAEFRKEWARAMLLELIDAEIAGLEAHRATLDFETIELDRAEASARALFDASRTATLARRYESEARRGFFKALKEFRLVEAEFAANAKAAPIPPQTSQTPRSKSPTSSFGEMPPLPDFPPGRTLPTVPSTEKPVGRTLENHRSAISPAPKSRR